jgi:phthiocerol/phenolphthiocerol synthesis type-I polyketide synthase E
VSRHLSPDFDRAGHREIAAEIAALWADLFGDDELVVLPGDNFFTLGGSSRLALDLVSRLNERFAIRLNLLALVEAPVFDDLVARVAALTGDGEIEEGEL